MRQSMMDLLARPGETIHEVLQRMKCQRCGERGPAGPFVFADTDESTAWVCLHRTGGLNARREDP